MTVVPRARLTVVVLCLGGLVVSLTQTLVIPIQGELPTLLDTSVANAGWVVTVTLLAGAVSMPISGRLADIFGKQRVLVISTALLVVGALVSAVSTSLAPMLAGRALQGLSLGFIPVAITLLREVTPPELTNAAVSTMSATLGVGGAIGLPLSAWISDTFDWHALFWTAAGLAVLLLLAVWHLVPRVQDAHGGGVDVIGALGLALGLVLVLVGVTKGHEWGWAEAQTLGCLAGGMVVLAVWAWFELGRREPLVDLRVTTRRPVLLINLAAIAMGFGMMAQTVVIPQLMQLPRSDGGLGLSTTEAGMWMAPGALMMLVFAPVSARLLTAVGGRLTLMLGAAVLAGGYVVGFALMDAPWQLTLACLVINAGVGIGYAAMPTLVMASVERSKAGAGVGLNTLMRSIGSTSSAAVMTTVLSGSATSSGAPSAGAFQLCFAIGGFAALGAVALTWFVPAVRRTSGAEAEPASAPASV